MIIEKLLFKNILFIVSKVKDEQTDAKNRIIFDNLGLIYPSKSFSTIEPPSSPIIGKRFTIPKIKFKPNNSSKLKQKKKYETIKLVIGPASNDKIDEVLSGGVIYSIPISPIVNLIFLILHPNASRINRCAASWRITENNVGKNKRDLSIAAKAVSKETKT